MTADTKDLIARAKDAARVAPNGAFLRELADALERLTQQLKEAERDQRMCFACGVDLAVCNAKLAQPVGVEPVALYDGIGSIMRMRRAKFSIGDRLYSAETVARLAAERDAAQLAATAEANRVDELFKERDALQEQVSWIRNHFSERDGGLLITGMDGAFVLKWMSLVDEILAATENKEPAA